ncbi:3-keto sterol reductase [Crassisporium funariophilum]|nr:3-keto sterol reductase [Crassisporium funariophilum]
MSSQLSPVVIVTGANGGVGFGICQRLLLQLCQPNPPDALPQLFASNIKKEGKGPATYTGVTMILACRNMKRADKARTKLLHWFEEHVDELSQRPEDDGYATAFLANCEVQIRQLDLASIQSVLEFAATMRKELPYISHLICNAGVASFKGIDWPLCIMQLIRAPMSAITAPTFYTQHVGEISGDNLGWVWQCNVFGHFALFRELEALLAKTPFETARVIWCSSLEASPKFYDSNDWQLKTTEHSYESTKYQTDLIATNLDHLALRSTNGKQIRHFVSEPGVCATTISQALTAGPLLEWLKVFAFYLGRLFGSPHHSIDPYKAAIATVHLMLVPLCFIPLFLNNNPSTPIRFGAQTGRWGAERVGVTVVKEWDTHKEEGLVLIKKCDDLLKSMKEVGGTPRARDGE